MRLETARLILSPWQADDVPAFHALASDPEVVRYISDGVPWPRERAQEFVARQIGHFRERQFCLWKLTLKETGEFAGFCGIQPWGDTGEVEIGWWLAQAHWRKGLAIEAAREALRDAFERVGLRRIVSLAVPENERSIHIMRKLGMQFERMATHRGYEVALYAAANPREERNRASGAG